MALPEEKTASHLVWDRACCSNFCKFSKHLRSFTYDGSHWFVFH